jgi:RNA polymerase sigma factor (sigma-70 family)
MAVSPAKLVQHLRRLVAFTAVDASADAVLLGRFVNQRDEAAFSELVGRHGAMVLRVCRRVLGDVHLAEDAFQATFLVLARKAANIRSLDSVAAWLHGVALRLALKARSHAALHHLLDQASEPVDPGADPLNTLTARELLTVLDEEIQQLPEVYRLPLVLCCLEGHTQDEAARLLRWTPGSVKGRLERGRRRLHSRLAQRGLTLAAALAAIEWSRAAMAAGVPAGLTTTAVQTALVFAGEMPGVGIAERVAALAQYGLRDMAMARLKVVFAVMMALAIGGLVAAGVAVRLTAATGPQTPVSDSKQIPPEGNKQPPKDKHDDPLPPGALARLGTVRLRAAATALSLSPDGKTLITASGGRTIGRVDAANGLLIGETHLAGSFAEYNWFSPDGKILANCVPAGLELWDTTTGKRLHLLPVETIHIAFSPDSKTLLTTNYVYDKKIGRIRLWDVATGKDRLFAEHPNSAEEVAFAPDGQRLFALIDYHWLRSWDVASGKQLWENKHAGANLAVAPDGKTICTDTYLGGPLHLWDAKTGKHMAQLGKETLWTGNIAFSPDSTLIAQGTWQETVLWDVASRKVRHRFAGAGPHVAFAADSRSLFTAGKLLLRWDVATGKLLYADKRSQGHIGPVTVVAFAPDGRSVATCGEDGTVRYWSLPEAAHRVLRTDAPADRIWATTAHSGRWPTSAVILGLTPDGKHVVTNTAAGPLALTEIATGHTVRQFKLPEPPKNGSIAVAGARLTADGRTLLMLGTIYEQPTSDIRFEHQYPLRGWELATGKEMLARTITGPLLDSAKFAPDGRLVVLPPACRLHSVKMDGKRSLVDAPIDLGETFAFSPDGWLLAVTEPGRMTGPATALRIYEVLTGRLLARMEAPLGFIPALAFSPDGRLLAAAGADALHVWESTTGKRLMHLPARGRLTSWTPDAFATCMAFAPDGKSLATGHSDGTVLVWDMVPARKGLAGPAGQVDVPACWDALAAVDAKKGWAAIEHLASAGAKALPVLRQNLRPVKVDPKWLTARLADLDSDKFAVREAAIRDLEKVADEVESVLRRMLEKPPSEEVRTRLTRIIKILEARPMVVPSPDEVRQLRAVLVLERIGSEEARMLLAELAAGAPDARLTLAAKGALERLKK